MSYVRDPNSIVRVKNNMTGDESHFIYESSDKTRSYHIPAGATKEMRWRDYLELQQHEVFRKYFALADDTIITADGEVLLNDMKSSEAIPIENIHEILALPIETASSYLKGMNKGNLVRIKTVAEEQGRTDIIEQLDKLIKSRRGRPKSQE